MAPIILQSDDPRGAHEWWIEFIQTPTDLDAFGRVIDEHLIRSVEDYAAHRRDDAQLLAPRIVSVPSGTFEQYLRRHGKLGGQHKVPEAWGDRTIADELARNAQEGTC